MRSHHQHVLAHPYRTLVTAFAAWKLFLFAIVVASCVGGAYDTSAALVVLGSSGGNSTSFSRKVLVRFASWDAIYFVSAARRGYRFEQEWAFGTGLPIVTRGLIQALTQFGLIPQALIPHGVAQDEALGSALLETLVGVAVANTSHLLSTAVLYRLGLLVWRPAHHPQGPLLALIAALLHVISPAGLFLSAPYAESSFALLSFTGYFLYARSCLSSGPWSRDGYVVLAGLSFGLATAFRSNGILNGVPFAWEFLELLPSLANALFIGRSHRSMAATTDIVRRLAALGVGGVAVAAGSLIPQAVAYQQFCSGSSGAEAPGGDALQPRRLWCEGYLPSVYAFVQQHYWNTGFLRYWNLSNLPLFLLASPLLVILAKSGSDYVFPPVQARPKAGKKAPTVESTRIVALLRSAAAAQVLLAVLAVTMYHVQIITRISSGYPLWYWWLAGMLIRGEKLGSGIAMFMVMYASVQGVLFASFLPPA
ncbi:glycosyltransferase family 76 protein [Lasiosphaeria hispida]|uniref:GPI mannosyltransferase 2 n=1 Tax=Lasiosphaeria hispida TaxID=260671 RepID=A0AAJ0HFS5_9PEZI|nr:glycosyltransferase family 76 protein [Lasiosphaeria hispida]